MQGCEGCEGAARRAASDMIGPLQPRCEFVWGSGQAGQHRKGLLVASHTWVAGVSDRQGSMGCSRVLVVQGCLGSGTQTDVWVP